MKSVKQYNLRGCSVGITDGRDLRSTPLRWPQWHDIRTKFRYDRWSHSGNVKVIKIPQQFDRLQCWYYWWEGFMKYAVEMASDSMIYIVSFLTLDSGIQVILRLLPLQFERLQCWYYWWERFKKYTVAVASCGYTYQVSWRSVQAFK
jgi:hypothetical protein